MQNTNDFLFRCEAKNWNNTNTLKFFCERRVIETSKENEKKTNKKTVRIVFMARQLKSTKKQ